MAQKLSRLPATHGQEKSHGDGSLRLRKVRLEGLGARRVGLSLLVDEFADRLEMVLHFAAPVGLGMRRHQDVAILVHQREVPFVVGCALMRLYGFGCFQNVVCLRVVLSEHNVGAILGKTFSDFRSRDVRFG